MTAEPARSTGDSRGERAASAINRVMGSSDRRAKLTGRALWRGGCSSQRAQRRPPSQQDGPESQSSSRNWNPHDYPVPSGPVPTVVLWAGQSSRAASWISRSALPTTLRALSTLAASRWPEGFRCPACTGRRAWVLERRHLWECADCHQQTSVTAGTVMHGTRTSLRLWFWSAYLVATHTPGISAVQLQRQLGISR